MLFLTRVVLVARPQPQAAQGFALSSAQQLESSKTIGQAWNQASWLYHSSLWKSAPEALLGTEITLYLISVSKFFFLEFISLVLWKQHLEATILHLGVTQFYCTSWEKQSHLICSGKNNLIWFALILWFFSSEVHLLFPHCDVHPVQVTHAFIDTLFIYCYSKEKHPGVLNQCLNGSCTVPITIPLPFSELLPVPVSPPWAGLWEPELHKQVKMQTRHVFMQKHNHVLWFVLYSFPITPRIWCLSLTAVELWADSFNGMLIVQVFAQASSHFFLFSLHLSTFNLLSYFFCPVPQHL